MTNDIHISLFSSLPPPSSRVTSRNNSPRRVELEEPKPVRVIPSHVFVVILTREFDDGGVRPPHDFGPGGSDGKEDDYREEDDDDEGYREGSHRADVVCRGILRRESWYPPQCILFYRTLLYNTVSCMPRGIFGENPGHIMKSL